MAVPFLWEYYRFLNGCSGSENRSDYGLSAWQNINTVYAIMPCHFKEVKIVWLSEAKFLTSCSRGLRLLFDTAPSNGSLAYCQQVNWPPNCRITHYLASFFSRVLSYISSSVQHILNVVWNLFNWMYHIMRNSQVSSRHKFMNIDIKKCVVESCK